MILDTNALSAMADGDPKLEPVLTQANEVAIPVIVLGEYRYGILQSRHRRQYEQWLVTAIASCRVLIVDEKTATEYADVRNELKQQSRPIPRNDVWIAALARQYEIPVLSRDEHFDLVPRLKRVTW